MSNYFLVEGKLRVVMRWVRLDEWGRQKRVLKISELNKKEKMDEY